VAFIRIDLHEARKRRLEPMARLAAAPTDVSPRSRRHAREHLADAVGADHHQQELDAVLQERAARRRSARRP
jgi:hypothetical protein